MESMETNPQPPPPLAPRPERPPRRPSMQLSAMTWLLIFLVLLLILPYMAERVQFAVTRGRQRARAEVAKVTLREAPEPSSRFAWVAQSIEPSVVGIETTRVLHGRYRDEWSQLFQSGEGSGVIVDEAGYVVTNAHVIDGAAELTIKLSDGRTLEAVELVGADPWADLAVLKIEAGGLVAAAWGDSDRLEVGDEVLAVGNPYQLDRTVTAGIVSAKDRPGVVGDLPRAEFLQTDAAVNPGNSGGPLVNMKGEVVGINLAIVGSSYRGISFAIPSNRVRDVYKRLRRTREVAPRGFLGVIMWDVNERLAFELRLDEVSGVVVARVESGSPADQAGVRESDVIVEWNGRKVDSGPDLRMLVARSKVGSLATVVVIREGRRLELTVQVGERPILDRQ